jgi:tetratricopeptide (TPR) repeat protein
MEGDRSKEQDAGLAAQIAELARQVVETRNQMIKTSNALANLSSEIRDLGRTQQEQRRRMILNSAAAYVLFVVLIAAAFYFTYRSRIERVDLEKDTVLREQQALKSKLETLRLAAERRREAEGRAAAFHRLSQSGQVQQALAQYPTVAQLPLTPVEAAVFQDFVSRSRSRLAYAAYSAGVKAMGEQHFKRAAAEFQRSLGFVPSPPHEASLRYNLGIALARLGSYQEAAAELERALAADAENVVSSEIRYHLGTIYEQLGRRDRAKAAYAAYIKAHPATALAAQARRKLKALK